MGLLLAFTPFIAFAVIDRLVGGTEGLIAGAAVALIMIGREVAVLKESPKLLDVGTALLFGCMALYKVFGHPDWSIMDVRLRVDAGLMLIVLVSLAARRPFTLQYARESVPTEFWNSERFVRTNYVITAAWALAFVVLVVADLLLIYRPDIPPRVGVIATVLALVGAFKFTTWYPKRVRSAA